MDFVDITINGSAGNGGLRRWEGSIPYLYLDSRKVNGVASPLVTVGIGCAVGPATLPKAPDEVLGLPWTIGGGDATEDDIQTAWTSICHAPFGYAAMHYAGTTSIRLSDDAMLALCRNRLDMFISSLMRSFPAFDGWPETCKAGALDLIYGVGVSGFQQYHHFISACLAENWQMAADQCASDANIAAYDARNAARKQLFLDAFSDPSS